MVSGMLSLQFPRKVGDVAWRTAQERFQFLGRLGRLQQIGLANLLSELVAQCRVQGLLSIAGDGRDNEVELLGFVGGGADAGSLSVAFPVVVGHVRSLVQERLYTS